MEYINVSYNFIIISLFINLLKRWWKMHTSMAIVDKNKTARYQLHIL